MKQRRSGQARGRGGSETGERVGLLLSGAAARGPYQAGALAELLPALLDEGHRPVVLLGTSSGAITAALLAQFADRQADAGQNVVDTWLGFGKVFANPLVTLPADVGRMLVRAVLRGGLVGPIDGLLDTAPLRRRAGTVFVPGRVSANIESGLVRSLAVAATLCPSGGSAARSRLFVQGALPGTGLRENAVDVVPIDEFGVGHLLASAAIPVLFPPEYVADPPAQRGYYIDGGVRLNAPFDAALAMGVTRLVVISGHSVGPPPAPPPLDRGTPPDLAFTTAIALRAVLADSLSDDLQALGRHNEWVQRMQGVVPSDEMPYRRVPYRLVAPDDGQLAQLAAGAFRPCGPGDPYWVIGRLLDAIGGGIGRDELLSLILFDPGYAEEQVELGRRHARIALAMPWHDGFAPEA
ncbi:patatin-like phospholipase family protein [Pseudonocardia sp. H11422]|uniref:patatin-like phospholipase family protein n=1 Tax=Pseudonocardia sp. H11422 TaxID=2835866 RepID=UPI001BDBFD11|nr:patatin-like phospholipase family protein [Pseudonocardia sp. H11422]